MSRILICDLCEERIEDKAYTVFKLLTDEHKLAADAESEEEETIESEETDLVDHAHLACAERYTAKILEVVHDGQFKSHHP